MFLVAKPRFLDHSRLQNFLQPVCRFLPLWRTRSEPGIEEDPCSPNRAGRGPSSGWPGYVKAARAKRGGTCWGGKNFKYGQRRSQELQIDGATPQVSESARTPRLSVLGKSFQHDVVVVVAHELTRPFVSANLLRFVAAREDWDPCASVIPSRIASQLASSLFCASSHTARAHASCAPPRDSMSLARNDGPAIIPPRPAGAPSDNWRAPRVCVCFFLLRPCDCWGSGPTPRGGWRGPRRLLEHVCLLGHGHGSRRAARALLRQRKPHAWPFPPPVRARAAAEHRLTREVTANLGPAPASASLARAAGFGPASRRHRGYWGLATSRVELSCSIAVRVNDAADPVQRPGHACAPLGPRR